MQGADRNGVRHADSAVADDRALCAGLRASDRETLREIFFLFRDDLVRYVTTIIRDGSVAHDLVQDVFVSLWDLRERLDPDCALRSYVFRMARNRAYRYLRDERLHAEKHDQLMADGSSNGSAVEQPDAIAQGLLMGAYLERWLAALPERQREALILSRYQGLSHREIASVMGISARTVNNHILRALAHLDEQVRSLETAASRTDGRFKERHTA